MILADGKLSKIYNHFGRDAQIKKLRDEVEEFIEALISGDRSHITEEYADVCVVMNGLVSETKIESLEVKKIYGEKIDRTLERIENGYYEGAK